MTNGFTAVTLAVVSTMLAGALAGLPPASSPQPAPGGEIQPAPGFGGFSWGSKPMVPAEMSGPEEDEPAEFPTVPSLPEPGEWWEPWLKRSEFVMYEDMPTRTGEFFLYDDTTKLAVDARGLFGREELPKGARGYELTLLTEGSEPAAEVGEQGDLGERILPNLFFDLVALDDTRYTGTFYERGVRMTYSIPGEAAKDWRDILLDPDDYALLQQRAQQLVQDPEKPRMPSWLCMMHDSRMTQAKATGRDGQWAVYDVPGTAWYFADDLRVPVTGPGVYTQETSLPDAAQVEIEFNNGLVFRIFYTDKELLVAASDVPGGLLYQTKWGSRPLNTIEAYAHGDVFPPTD